jgi:predicted dehydrogenase
MGRKEIMGEKEPIGAKLRIGIIGLGRVATATHIPVLKQFDEVEITACAESNPGRVQRVREFFEIPHFFSDYHEMCASQFVDAVYICLPPHLHYDATLCALNNNIHVLCEKPMGKTAHEAAEMSRSAKQKTLVLMPGFKYRYNENIQKAAAVAASGLLGKILQIEATFMTPGPYISWDPKSEWYLEKEQGGVVYDIGVHIIELLHTLVPARMSEIYARDTVGFARYDTPTNVTCSFSMEKDITGTVVFGWRSAVDYVNISIFGTAGALNVGLKTFDYLNAGTDPKDRIANHVTNSYVELRTVLKRVGSILKGTEVSVQDLLQARTFAGAIRRGEEPPVTAEDAVYVHQVLEAIMKSIQDDRSIEIAS